MNIIAQLCSEFNLKEKNVTGTVALIDEGNTIPFIARYRKEITGSLDDKTLRLLDERLKYLRGLDERRNEIIRLIEESGNLTDDLKNKINSASIIQELEDIYRPYRPKKKTRASVAKERGLEPLAQIIYLQNEKKGNPLDIAAKFVNTEKEIFSPEDAIFGACDIIAEMISDNDVYRKKIRNMMNNHGMITTKAVKDEDSVYSMYYDFCEPVKSIANHRILAIDRGEKEDYLRVSVDIDTDAVTLYIEKCILKNSIFDDLLKNTVRDSYTRLIKPSVEREIRTYLTQRAERGAIDLFGNNLTQLLMQPPIRGKTVLGFDPGYRTGCKLAVVDETGKVIATDIIFCTLKIHDKEKSARKLKKIINDYNVDIISIGNGTASGESEQFVSQVLSEIDKDVKYIITNEAGASVYSASPLGSEEFPNFTVEQRSAASIARRIQDPLSELVKIDPKSIGVGQYQHDVNQKLLGEKLSGVVEDCVNNVGVDLNTASWPLLSHVAGINKTVAKNIVKYRDEHGKFESRKELMKVEKLGAKSFLQCAGFLKIPGAKNFFDTTRVHPESYKAAEMLLELAGCNLSDVNNIESVDFSKDITKENIRQITEKFKIGLPTVKDIEDSLKKPDLDPRDEISPPVMKTEILTFENLKIGDILTGTVRNITDFGAFVDIGVHQDGLVHISEISNRYIRHPSDVLKVGDIIKTVVIAKDDKKQKISLSMKRI